MTMTVYCQSCGRLVAAEGFDPLTPKQIRRHLFFEEIPEDGAVVRPVLPCKHRAPVIVIGKDWNGGRTYNGTPGIGRRAKGDGRTPAERRIARTEGSRNSAEIPTGILREVRIISRTA